MKTLWLPILNPFRAGTLLVFSLLLSQYPSGHTIADQSYCVRVIEGVPGGHTWVANPLTSLFKEDVQYDIDLNLTVNALPSSDHKYAIASHNLNERAVIFESSSRRPIKTLDRVRNFAWAPDSQTFAYTWMDDSSRLLLTIADVLTDNVNTRDISYVPIREVWDISWSGDGQYIVTSPAADEGNIDPIRFRYWSRKTAAPIEIDTNLIMLYQPPIWSPNDHSLAVMGSDAEGNWYLGILTPPSDKPVQFKLPSKSDNPEII